MPRTLDEAFRDFLARLTPSDSESDAAKRHRASIQACLQRHFGLQGFFRTGSFGNATSISGHSDVDYFAWFDSGTLTTDSGYSLQKVRDALDAAFPRTGVRVNCPAIKVPFGADASETTEIVPSEPVDLTASKDVIYRIPDCRGGWMRSSPEAHKAYVRTQDERLDRKVRPLIRFIKAWKYFCNVPVSSFYLEMRAAQYAATQTSIIYYIDLAILLRKLLNEGLGAMQDPSGVSGLIQPCETSAQHDDAMSKVQTALSRADRAFAAERANNTKDAIEALDLLFGGQFPRYYR